MWIQNCYISWCIYLLYISVSYSKAINKKLSNKHFSYIVCGTYFFRNEKLKLKTVAKEYIDMSFYFCLILIIVKALQVISLQQCPKTLCFCLTFWERKCIRQDVDFCCEGKFKAIWTSILHLKYNV